MVVLYESGIKENSQLKRDINEAQALLKESSTTFENEMNTQIELFKQERAVLQESTKVQLDEYKVKLATLEEKYHLQNVSAEKAHASLRILNSQLILANEKLKAEQIKCEALQNELSRY